MLVLWNSLVVLYLLFSLWCCGMIWFQRWIVSKRIKLFLVCLFALVSIGLAVLCSRERIFLLIGYALSFCVTVLWHILMQPAGQRDWDIPCSRIPTVLFSDDGQAVTIGNIRDFHYRSQTDYDVRYRTETYRLEDLISMDYIITHWGPELDLIGHVILSFGFSDGRHLVVSGETRIEKKDSKSLLAGIFRQYELIYILGTEEDLLQLRTNHRHQRVYLYPCNIKQKNIPVLFTDLVQRAADLGPHPKFYNTLLYNCTNSLSSSADKTGFAFGKGLTGMINGVFDLTAYYSGRLVHQDENESFSVYKQRHFANQYVEGMQDPPDYSRLIRPELKMNHADTTSSAK